MNTILGGSGAGITVLVINRTLIGSTWSYLMTLNGALSGMVIMCAGCNVYQPWAAILVGIFGGFGFVATHTLMLKFKLDDPLDAVAVHGTSGLLGVICVPIFSYDSGLISGYSEAWTSLGVNVLGAFAIIVWSAAWSTAIFYPLSKYGLYRIDRNTEFRGNDIMKHGEMAYPGDAWVELQVRKMIPLHFNDLVCIVNDISSIPSTTRVTALA